MNNEVERLFNELDNAFKIIGLFTEQAMRDMPAAYATLVIEINKFAKVSGMTVKEVLDKLMNDIEEIEVINNGDNIV